MANLPPASPALYILLALTSGERHGYDIMKEVATVSQGAIHLGPATLYTTIKRLLENGLLEEAGERPDADMDDQRRRYYRLTGAGKKVVKAELDRMDHLVRTFKPRTA